MNAFKQALLIIVRRGVCDYLRVLYSLRLFVSLLKNREQFVMTLSQHHHDKNEFKILNKKPL